MRRPTRAYRGPVRLAVALLVVGVMLAGWWRSAPMAAANESYTAAPASPELVSQGEALFISGPTPDQGLGPFYNGTACASCHLSPRVGGMGKEGVATVTRIGRLTSAGFDPLLERGGPVARAHATLQVRAACLPAGAIPTDVDVRSVRNTPALFGMGLIDQIPDEAILALAVPRGDGVRGHANMITGSDGQQRGGRFGWKADQATLEQRVADAFRNEQGVTSPLAPLDLTLPSALPAACPGLPGGSHGSVTSAPEDDGSGVAALTAFVAALPPPVSPDDPVGEQLFAQVGCASCHTPSLPTPSGEAHLYSDLLLHDMGPGLDDLVVQGDAARRDWRTTPLWGLSERQRFLHDGRARSIEVAIGAHSGEASTISHRYANLPPSDRAALLHFLETR